MEADHDPTMRAGIDIDVNSAVGGHARQDTMDMPMPPDEPSHDPDDDYVDDMDDVPIGPFAQRSGNRAGSMQHGADDLPQLPDEDMDTDGFNTDTEDGNKELFGTYESPGGVIETHAQEGSISFSVDGTV